MCCLLFSARRLAAGPVEAVCLLCSCLFASLPLLHPSPTDRRHDVFEAHEVVFSAYLLRGAVPDRLAFMIPTCVYK